MNYHNITTDDMLNGDGLRTVLWVAGCEHHCDECQNPITWNPDGGIYFDKAAENELMQKLEPDYISGVTFSGGDPLHLRNHLKVAKLCHDIKERFPDKTVWIYTGYLWEEIRHFSFLRWVDVIVDGPFVKELKDVKYHWAGSTNQRVIDVQKSLEAGEVILYEKNF